MAENMLLADAIDRGRHRLDGRCTGKWIDDRTPLDGPGAPRGAPPPVIYGCDVMTAYLGSNPTADIPAGPADRFGDWLYHNNYYTADGDEDGFAALGELVEWSDDHPDASWDDVIAYVHQRWPDVHVQPLEGGAS